MRSSLYTLRTPLTAIKGVGPATARYLTEQEISTAKDLLLILPNRYVDRSKMSSISDVKAGETVTLMGNVTGARSSYRGRRSFQTATLSDETGKLKLYWFNNPHVVSRILAGQVYAVSGKVNDRGGLTQPIIEAIRPDQETIHTGRLVPVYPMVEGVRPATFRRLLKHVLDHLQPIPDQIVETAKSAKLAELPLDLDTAIHQLHFPEEGEIVIKARERFALEEFIGLILHSQHLKEEWRKSGEARVLKLPKDLDKWIDGVPLPYELTNAQKRSTKEILEDLAQPIPMNRLLIGDVGSGKTVVAGLAMKQALAAGWHACLIVPTRILADQHLQTLQKIFPELPIHLVTAQTTKKDDELPTTPTVFLGTHSVLNRLEKLKPGLMIYDEQHRFGVAQRSASQELRPRPHVLTLSATPIPRTLMLSIFAHLQMSVIDELPAGRLPVKTWLTSEQKRPGAYEWLFTQVQENQHQALLVCPFIDPSEAEGLEKVPSAALRFEELQKVAKEWEHAGHPPLRIALLHGRQKKPEQKEITDKLYNREIDILVTTPIVEVGVDSPAASIIVIEAAERFGLASLHQLRGRVGRAGQQAYCLLFTTMPNPVVVKRLTLFSQVHNGLELAEQDLQRRGAGDLFGTVQHGFDQLRFGNWSNVELIHQAQQFAKLIQEKNLAWDSEEWVPPLKERTVVAAN